MKNKGIFKQITMIGLWSLLFSIPKTIYFNFKVLPIKKAIKFPFIISYHIKLHGVSKKSFIVDYDDVSFFSSRIGFEYTAGSFQESKNGLIFIENGKIVLHGPVGWSQGTVISAKNSEIHFGKNFRSNYSAQIVSCDKDIYFGDDVVLGWKCTIKSDDGHYIIKDGVLGEKSKEVIVGNHVWICSNSTLLKGTKIGNDSVVAYDSLIVNKEFGDNVLVGGKPAKVIYHNIDWKE